MALLAALRTTAGTVKSGVTHLHAITLAAGAAADASIVVYDNTGASGTIIAYLVALQGTFAQISLPLPVACARGLYANLAGTGAYAVLYYS